MREWVLRDYGTRSFAKKHKVGVRKGYLDQIEILDPETDQTIGFIYMENDRIIVSSVLTHPRLEIFDCIAHRCIDPKTGKEITDLMKTPAWQTNKVRKEVT